MAALPPFFAPGTKTGSQETIEVKVVFVWDSVGSGTVSAFSNFQVGFEGQISSVFYKGAFNLSLALSDQNPASTSGPAAITINGQSDNNARYQTNGNQLTVNATLGGKSETITFHAGDGGTYVNLGGAISQSVWLKPQ
ncbi:MAG TPA: hypothetical protein VFP84_19495 [Kofleriaceae bacterium]|nr:hypothetical protein [Kofleriaceae bacterium]